MKTIAIYHKDCTDGTAAAALVLRKYPDALLFPLGHGYEKHELDAVLAAAEKGDRILTVDCVIGAKEFLAAGHAVTSIDHHIGIEEEYKKLAQENPAYAFIFDNKHSGAGLAWVTLFPDEPMPELVKLVEDRDLWNWKFSPDTDNLTNRLWMYDNKPQEVLAFMFNPLESLKAEGKVITEYTNALVDRAFENIEPLEIKIGDYAIPFFNLTEFKSQLGNMLSTQHKGVVGLYSIQGMNLHISFRCLEEHKPSALEVAKLVNGGGHRNAAGAKMPLDQFYKSLVRK